MTRQTIRTEIAHLSNTLGYGVGFRGGSDAHLAAVHADGGRGELIVKGKIEYVRNFLELVAE